MAITYPITFPTTVAPSEFSLEFRPQQGIAVSPFSGQAQSYTHNGIVWYATVQLPPMTNNQLREYHGFLVALNGVEGSFTCPTFGYSTPAGTQNANFNLASDEDLYSKELSVDGMTASATLIRGDILSIADRIYMITEDVTASGSGTATIKISHGLRAAASSGAAVNVIWPVGTWRLEPSQSIAQSQMIGGVGQVYSFAMAEVV